jgi:hypothetical protein
MQSGAMRLRFSLSKKSKITFFTLEKQLENGYSTLAKLGSFFLEKGFFDKLKAA